jgi:hypothetical protein
VILARLVEYAIGNFIVCQRAAKCMKGKGVAKGGNPLADELNADKQPSLNLELNLKTGVHLASGFNFLFLINLSERHLQRAVAD